MESHARINQAIPWGTQMTQIIEKVKDKLTGTKPLQTGVRVRFGMENQPLQIKGFKIHEGKNEFTIAEDKFGREFYICEKKNGWRMSEILQMENGEKRITKNQLFVPKED